MLILASQNKIIPLSPLTYYGNSVISPTDIASLWVFPSCLDEALATHTLIAISTPRLSRSCPQRELRAQAVEKRSQPQKPKKPLSNQEFRNPHNDPNALQVGFFCDNRSKASTKSGHLFMEWALNATTELDLVHANYPLGLQLQVSAPQGSRFFRTMSTLDAKRCACCCAWRLETHMGKVGDFSFRRLLFGRLSIVCSHSKELRCVRGCVLSRFPRPVHELTGIFTFPSSPFWF